MDNCRKNRWRKQEFQRVREQRVINGYVEKKHPQIFKEALDFYKFLDEKYPTKKDLRRTNEFEWIKTGISGQTTRKFYAHKKTTTTTTTKTVKEYDQMQLVIPLMTETTVSTKAKFPSPTVTTTNNFESSQPQAEPSINDEQPQAEPFINYEQPTVNEEQPPLELSETVINSTTNFEPTLNEGIPDHIIEEIIDSLQKDPYLEDFFSTINMDFDEESTLERELALN